MAWISAVLTVFYQILKDKNYIYLSLLVYFVVITQFDFSIFDSKESFSAVTIFMFLVYSDNLRLNLQIVIILLIFTILISFIIFSLRFLGGEKNIHYEYPRVLMYHM